MISFGIQTILSSHMRGTNPRSLQPHRLLLPIHFLRLNEVTHEEWMPACEWKGADATRRSIGQSKGEDGGLWRNRPRQVLLRCNGAGSYITSSDSTSAFRTLTYSPVINKVGAATGFYSWPSAPVRAPPGRALNSRDNVLLRVEWGGKRLWQINTRLLRTGVPPTPKPAPPHKFQKNGRISRLTTSRKHAGICLFSGVFVNL